MEYGSGCRESISGRKTDVVTVRSQTPLLQLVRQMVDAHADRLIVVDELDRPIGIVSAPDVLSAVAKELVNEPRQQCSEHFSRRD